MEHALRNTLVADALSLQFRLPPANMPPPTVKSSPTIANGAPTVDALVVTSVWAVHILRMLCQVEAMSCGTAACRSRLQPLISGNAWKISKPSWSFVHCINRLQPWGSKQSQQHTARNATFIGELCVACTRACGSQAINADAGKHNAAILPSISCLFPNSPISTGRNQQAPQHPIVPYQYLPTASSRLVGMLSKPWASCATCAKP